MTLEFQKNVISYLVKYRDNNILEKLTEDVFELNEHKVIFSLVKEYNNKYNKLPSEANLIEYLNINTKDVSKETFKSIKNDIIGIYKTKLKDYEFIKDQIISFIQKRKLKELMKTNSDISAFDEQHFNHFFKEVQSIISINDNGNNSKGIWLLKDNILKKRRREHQIYPTYMPKWNTFMTKGGFSAPELVGLLCGPKGFKTGFAINIAVNYVIGGLKCYYADFDNNSEEDIAIRAQQCIAECTYGELHSGEFDDVMKSQMRTIRKFGGDIRIKSYPADLGTVDDVKADLLKLKEENDWEPDFIIWDYLPKIGRKDRKEGHEKIRANTSEVMNLQAELGIFGFTPLQLTREGIKEKRFGMDTMGGDIGLAQNLHACFGLESSPTEERVGIRRLTIIFQRMGLKPSKETYVDVFVDEARQTLKEINLNDLLDD